MNISKTLNIVSISNKDEIRHILKMGQRVYTNFGLIFLFKDEKKNLKKIGILVKKKSGSAVKRNYIKRIIRQFIRIEYNQIRHFHQILFLYNFQGKISYKELSANYKISLKKHEENITCNN
jgi:ribonuclease P protein component